MADDADGRRGHWQAVLTDTRLQAGRRVDRDSEPAELLVRVPQSGRRAVAVEVSVVSLSVPVLSIQRERALGRAARVHDARCYV